MKEKETCNKLKKISSFSELFKVSMYAIFPSKIRSAFLISALVVVSPKIFEASLSPSTIVIFDKIISITNNFALAIFGALMTAYSILFTLVRKEILDLLLSFPYRKLKKNEDKNKVPTIWEYINHSMIGTLLSFLIIIIINYSLSTFFTLVGDKWALPFPNKFNAIICFLFMDFYIAFTLNALIEIKSFIYSLTQVFYINNLIKLKENSKDE